MKKKPNIIVFFEPKAFLMSELNGAKTIWATENTEMIKLTSKPYNISLLSHYDY